MTNAIHTAKHQKSTYDKWIGMRFGRWVVIDLAGRKSNTLMLLARCDCGNEAVVENGNLSGGLSTQCAECGWEAARDTVLAKSIGKKIGKGSVVDRPDTRVTIRCQCGKTVTRCPTAISGKCTGLCDDCLRKHRMESDYMSGMSIVQVAELLGITKQGVSWYRINKGDAALAKRIAAAKTGDRP